MTIEVTARGHHIALLRVGVAAIMPLRVAVLFAHHEQQHASFPGDEHPLARHYAAYDVTSLDAAGREKLPALVEAGVIGPIGCASLMPSDYEGQPAWQVRGVAVLQAYRCEGVGRMLLDFAERDAADRPEFKRLWCSAVAGAVGFYEKLGWRMVDETYLLKGIGSHYKLLRNGERSA